MKFGLEKEMFVKDKAGELVLVPAGVPKDDCGYLAEARSLPFNNIEEAVYSLKADEHRIVSKLSELNLVADDTPVMKVSKKLLLQARRENAKGVISYRNLYNYEDHRHSSSECPSGVHISFTKEGTFRAHDNTIGHYNKMWDFPTLFKRLDSAFAKEIKDAKRNPGFYEIKTDGRIEYRSLPSNIDLLKVISVIKEFFK